MPSPFMLMASVYRMNGANRFTARRVKTNVLRISIRLR